MRKIRCSHSPYNLEEVTLIKIHAYACKQLLQMFQQRYHVNADDFLRDHRYDKNGSQQMYLFSSLKLCPASNSLWWTLYNKVLLSFVIKILKCTQMLKELYNEHVYINHLDSTVYIWMHLLYHIYIYL